MAPGLSVPPGPGPSQEAWQFAQNVAGQIWFGLGLVQTVVFAWVCLGMQTWSVEAQCQAALISILVEDVLVLLSMIPTEVLLGPPVWPTECVPPQ